LSLEVSMSIYTRQVTLVSIQIFLFQQVIYRYA